MRNDPQNADRLHQYGEGGQMNKYIMKPLDRIKKVLYAKQALSSDAIDSMIGELEQIKLNIEQHISYMPQNQEYHNVLSAAQNAVRNLTEILDLFEELVETEQYEERVDEILVLLDEISY